MTRAPRILRYIAFGSMALFAVFGSAFVIGEAMMDPGGVAGALMSAAWVVPMVGCAVYALRRPEPASRVLAVVTAAVSLFAVLNTVVAIVPRGIGPVGAVAVFAVGVVLGFLGLHRPVPAGGLMLLLGAAGLAGILRMPETGHGAPVGPALSGSSGATAIPILLIGVLFLVAGFWESRRKGSRHGARHGARHG